MFMASASVLAMRLGAAELPTAEIIVTSDLGSIPYEHIRCAPAKRANAEACAASERDKLSARVYALAIDAAAALHGLRLTPEESQRVDARVESARALGHRAAEEYMLIAEGVLRIRQGLCADEVIAELGRAGIKREMVESMLSRVATADEAKAILARDHIAETEAAASTYYTREMMRRKLAALVRERAAASGKPVAEEGRAFWEHVLSRYHFEVVKQPYQLPDFEGVLNENGEK